MCAQASESPIRTREQKAQRGIKEFYWYLYCVVYASLPPQNRCYLLACLLGFPLILPAPACCCRNVRRAHIGVDASDALYP